MTDIPFPESKICTGPAHPSPTRLPIAEFYVHKSGPNEGKPVARCRLCVNWGRLIHKGGSHGLVPTAKVRPLAVELVDRCGTIKGAATAHDLSATTLTNLIERRHDAVQKRVVARVVLALAEQRKIDRRNGSSERFLTARRFQAQREEQITRLSGY